jgi:hypothetical protein
MHSRILTDTKEKREPTRADFPVLDEDGEDDLNEGWPDEEYMGSGDDDDQHDERDPASGTTNERDKKEDWSKFNARMQRGAVKFALSPYIAPKTITVRIVLSPLVELMSQVLALGQAFDRKAAVKHSEGRAFACRLTAVTEKTGPALEKLRCLLVDQDTWHRALLPDWRNIHMRNLAFRMIARASGALTTLLAGPHMQHPYRLFKLLDESNGPLPTLAEQLKQDPPCMRDWFSSKFMEEHQDLTCPEALASFEAVADVARVSIAHVECRHATVRRIKMVSSTWATTLQTLSAHFCNLRLRLEGKGPYPPSPTPPRTSGRKPGTKHMLGWRRCTASRAGIKS